MYKLPSKTRIDKKYKLSDILKQINASKEARKESHLINSIILSNLLSPKTLNCIDNVELFIFEIGLKERIIPLQFLKEFDSKFKNNIIFCLKHEDYKLMLFEFKHNKFKGKYYMTNWNNDEDKELPLLQNVSEIYKFILSEFLNYSPLENESIIEYLTRNDKLVKYDLKMKKLKRTIATEVQSKKRFELNAKYKLLLKEKEDLLRGKVNE